MTVIVCIDEKCGMMFCGKRQSRDRMLRSRILEKTEGSRLLMNPYSASQFEESADNIISMENFLENAGGSDYVFVENKDVSEYISEIDSFIIYKWNRLYPSDMKFNLNLDALGYKLSSKEDFEGSSHERITEEVYVK